MQIAKNDKSMKVRAAAYIVENEKILLLKYEYGGKSVYNLPGGNVDFGETLAQTVVRELEEELGITAEIDRQIVIAETVLKKDNSVVLHTIFTAKIMKGIPTVNKLHTTAATHEWLPLAQLHEINLYPHVGKKLQELFFKPVYSAVFIPSISQPWF